MRLSRLARNEGLGNGSNGTFLNDEQVAPALSIFALALGFSSFKFVNVRDLVLIT